MSGKRNLLLLLIVITLALLVWLRPGIAPPEPAIPLTTLQPSSVNHIQISDASGRSIQLQKQAERWRMIAPQPAPANHDRVRQLLGITTTPVHSHFPAPQDLTQFGLAPAGIQLKLNQLTLTFGDIDPVYQRRYVLVDRRIHLIDDGFQHHLLAAAEAFIQPDAE